MATVCYKIPYLLIYLCLLYVSIFLQHTVHTRGIMVKIDEMPRKFTEITIYVGIDCRDLLKESRLFDEMRDFEVC